LLGIAPHFEKMLYDNAQLARVYLHAWQVTGEPFYRSIAEETLDYVVREMPSPEGLLELYQTAFDPRWYRATNSSTVRSASRRILRSSPGLTVL